jgi:long-chain acyl-CoA synthetase
VADQPFLTLFDHQTLPEVLRESVIHFGKRPLFGTKTETGWHWTTYKEFAVMVSKARAILKMYGVGRGDRIAIIAPNSLDFAVCAYAAFDRGAGVVAMYENQTDANWEYIIRDSGARQAFVSTTDISKRVSAMHPRLPALRGVHVLSDLTSHPDMRTSLEQRISSGLPLTRETRVDPSDLATIIYTSGTTGEPKGVPLTHGNICSNINTIRKLFPLGPGDRSMSFLPWAHVFGQVVELHCMLSLGASVGICESTDKIITNLAEVQPTILYSVPRIYEKIYDGVIKQMAGKPALIRKLFAAGMAAAAKQREGTALSLKERLALFLADRFIFGKIRAKFGGKLRFAISGGAALAKEVGALVDTLGIQVYEAYGLTETACISTNFPGSRKMGGVGKPIAGVQLTLDTSVTDDPTQGEVIVRGPSIMSGYYNRPDATAEAILPDGSFRTGDLGRIDADGHLFLTGRIKEQYKLGNGKYVAPSPLEDQLKLSPFIANAMLYGDNRLYNVALVVPDMKTLEAWARENGMTETGEALFRSSLVRSCIAREIERHSGEFHKYEKVAKFALIAEDFTQENGMLTPTFKLRRRNVMARYGATIEALYT